MWRKGRFEGKERDGENYQEVLAVAEEGVMVSRIRMFLVGMRRTQST